MARTATARTDEMTVSYMPKEEALRKRKSHVIEEQLKTLYKQHGSLTPDIILNAARNRQHPLHDHFEWDDSIAAEKYRRIEATQMLLASKFVCLISKDDGGPREVVSATPTRLYLPESRGGPFRMRNEVINDDARRTEFVARKKAQLDSWCKSVVDVPELNEIRLTLEKYLGR